MHFIVCVFYQLDEEIESYQYYGSLYEALSEYLSVFISNLFRFESARPVLLLHGSTVLKSRSFPEGLYCL